MKEIDVSSIVAAYNCEDTIGECVQSLLNQNLEGLTHEVVIVNDGSTDRTADILNGLVSPDLHILHLSRNQGCSVARNAAVEASCGKYLALLDADDIALPDRFRRQYRFLEESPDIAIVGSHVRLDSVMRRDTFPRYLPVRDSEIRKFISWRLPFWQTSVMIRREAFEGIDGFAPHWRYCEDCILFADILKNNKGANILETLTIKREDGEGLSFRMDSIRIFRHHLKSRFYAVHTLNLPWWHYLRAFLSASLFAVYMTFCRVRHSLRST